MNRARDLLKKSESIIRYIEDVAAVERATSAKDILPIIYGIEQVFPHWVTMICPAHHPEWFYVSGNAQQLFGYSADYMMNNMPPPKYLNEIHEDDQEELDKAMSFVGDFMRNEIVDDHHKYRLIFHYRFRKRDGTYAFIHDEKVVFQNAAGANLYYALFRDMIYEAEYNGVKVEIFKLDGSLRKVAEYKPGEAKKLSNRESQLMVLIKKGLTTKEIAHHLSISHNTVRNIRSRMYEKYNVNNALELLNRAG